MRIQYSTMPESWAISGEYFEACNCSVACPCIFFSDPTGEACTVLLGYHIEKGKAGNHSLDGLNFAVAAYSRGNMFTNKWEAAVYLDSKATERQRKALETIVSGKAGGVFGVLGSFIGKVHGVRSVPIDFRIEGKHRSLHIRGVGEMRVQTVDGAGGKEVTIANVPFGAETAVRVAKSEMLRLKDYGWDWNVSGKNSFFAPFSQKGP